MGLLIELKSRMRYTSKLRVLLCASISTFTFTVCFATYTYTHSPTFTHTHTHITTTNNLKSLCVCSSVYRRLNKIKFDNQHYALQLVLFGFHHIALTTAQQYTQIKEKELMF